MSSIRQVMNEWFVYTDTGVLGPFKFYSRAVAALREYEKDK